MGAGRRHRVVVGVETHQRQGIGLPWRHPPGLEHLLRQGKHRATLLRQQRCLGTALAPQHAVLIAVAIFRQPLVERSQGVGPRHRHEEVRPGEVQEPLHVALLVGATHQAEMMLEQMVTLQPEELAGHLPLARTRDLGHGDLRVVVTDPPRHAAKELEGPPMPFQEGLGAFAGKHLKEDHVAVGQRHREHRHAGRLTPQHDVRLAEVHLGFPGRMHKRQEYLLVLVVPGSDDLLDARVATGVVVLSPQPLEDPLGRVPLLPMHLLVATEDLVDDRHELADLRPLDRFLSLVLRRLRRRQDPLERVPMDLVLLASRPLAQLAGQNFTSNLNPFLHVAEHSFCSSFRGDGVVVTTQLSVTIRNQERLRALRFLTALRSPPRATLFLRPLQARQENTGCKQHGYARRGNSGDRVQLSDGSSGT